MQYLTADIHKTEYKGYTIEKDPEWGCFQSGPAQLIVYPTKSGIDHDYDYDGDSYRYCGNCKWTDSFEEAFEIIDDLRRAKERR